MTPVERAEIGNMCDAVHNTLLKLRETYLLVCVWIKYTRGNSMYDNERELDRRSASRAY